MRTKSTSQRDFSTRRLGSSRGGQTLQRRTGGAPYVILGTVCEDPRIDSGQARMTLGAGMTGGNGFPSRGLQSLPAQE